MYAPCMILIGLLGMNAATAFPIMMGSCAFLMPVASARFVKKEAYSYRPALGLAIGGIPGVLLAAYIFTSLPIYWVRWLVVGVVFIAATMMLRSREGRPRPTNEGRRQVKLASFLIPQILIRKSLRVRFRCCRRNRWWSTRDCCCSWRADAARPIGERE
jgi:uncharacterized membrane protein YfcA